MNMGHSLPVALLPENSAGTFSLLRLLQLQGPLAQRVPSL